jgi:hypothetical protein
VSYEIKMNELSQTIVGENERTKIINTLKDEVFKLK